MGVMTKDMAYWIEHLQLSRHPEGGYFRRTYQASEVMGKAHLPGRFQGARVFSTAIYYLLPGGEVSRFHRLKADELWHFHWGSALTLYIIERAGALVEKLLGAAPERGEAFQAVIPAGDWFGAVVEDPASFSLVGCTVAPGFEYQDFELADRQALLATYPQHRWIIERLARKGGQRHRIK
jgi:uncharacterized protein